MVGADYRRGSRWVGGRHCHGDWRRHFTNGRVIVVKCRQKLARVAAVLHTGGVPLTEELIAESRRLRRQLSILRRELEVERLRSLELRFASGGKNISSAKVSSAEARVKRAIHTLIQPPQP